MTPTPRLAFITIVATLAYLGLAILGWGGFAAFFSHPARIALAIALFVLSGVALLQWRKPEPRRARGSCQPLGLRTLGADRAAERLSSGLHRPVWVLDPRRRCHSLAWRRSLRRWWCVADLAGLCARPSVQRVSSHPTRAHAGHERCLYGVIRHPSYLGLLVNSLGWGLAFRSGVGVLLTALLIPPLLARIRAEERLLRTQFGAEYDAYCARTSRLIPRLLLMRAAAEGPVWVAF